MTTGDYERLLSKVEFIPECGCWIWTCGYSSTGYGSFWLGGRSIGAHRASWVLHGKDIGEGEVLCHKCDTPGCVNPDHLFVGSQKDNILDMHAKGRQHSNAGSRHGLHKVTEADVRQIRKRGRAGESIHSIARDFPITASTIRGILSGKEWRHVA